MPRYFIDLHVGDESFADEAGEIAPDLEIAKQIALKALIETAEFRFLETEWVEVQLKDETRQSVWSAVLSGGSH